MNVWNQWSGDVLTLMATFMGTNTLAAQTCVRSLMMQATMLPIGVAEGFGPLVGNMVGAGKPDIAKQFYRVAYGINWFIAMVIIVLFAGAKS